MEKSIVFKAEMTSLHYAENLVEKIALEVGLSDEVYGNVLLSVVEAVNNAILHGSGLDASKEVQICYSFDRGVLVIKVKDEGEGFDFENIADPTLPENIEKLTGRGIFLIKNLADDVDFLDKGRVLQITFNL